MKYILMFFVTVLASCQGPQGKKIIGETAYIDIKEFGIAYLSRIDTGATNTSIHAYNVKVEKPAKDKKDNVGKQATFETVNHDGVKKEYSSKIVAVTKVSNSQGTEYRYEVEMTLGWQGKDKKVTVNLRDGSKMTYKLLIGRNWLSKDYLVDVDKEAVKK